MSRETLRQRERACAGRVYAGSTSYPCQKNGVVLVRGSWYCHGCTPRKDDSRKDPEKREFVARRPCLLGRTDPEGCSGRVTVHHVRVLGGKRDDRRTVPLCQGHHQDGPRAYHKLGRQFAVVHNIDLPAEADRLHEQYLLERAA